MAIDTIKSTAVLDGAIATADIADDAVTSVKIDSTSTGMALADLAVDGSTLVVNATDNMIGIGDSTPAHKLDIKEDGTTAGIRLQHGGSNSYATIQGPLNRNLRIDLDANGDSDSLMVRDLRDGSLVLEARAGGDVVVNDGNLVIGTSGHGIDFSVTGDASAMTSELLDDYEEGRFDILFTDDNSGSETLSMRYTKVGQVVHVEGPNRGAAGSSNGQYALLSGTANSNINITSSLPFVPIESGSAISPIHRNLELRSDGTSPVTGYWRPILAWQASSATLYLADTRGSSAGEHAYWGGVNGQTLRKADTRTNIVVGFNFSYRTAS